MLLNIMIKKFEQYNVRDFEVGDLVTLKMDLESEKSDDILAYNRTTEHGRVVYIIPYKEYGIRVQWYNGLANEFSSHFKYNELDLYVPIKQEFFINREKYKDIDPYGEENWNDEDAGNPGNLIHCDYCHDRITDDELFLYKNKTIHALYKCCHNWCKDNGVDTKEMKRVNRINYLYTLKESYNELDPYGEDNWDEDDEKEYDLSHLTTIEKLKKIREILDVDRDTNYCPHNLEFHYIRMYINGPGNEIEDVYYGVAHFEGGTIFHKLSGGYIVISTIISEEDDEGDEITYEENGYVDECYPLIARRLEDDLITTKTIKFIL